MKKYLVLLLIALIIFTYIQCYVNPYAGLYGNYHPPLNEVCVKFNIPSFVGDYSQFTYTDQFILTAKEYDATRDIPAQEKEKVEINCNITWVSKNISYGYENYSITIPVLSGDDVSEFDDIHSFTNHSNDDFSHLSVEMTMSINSNDQTSDENFNLQGGTNSEISPIFYSDAAEPMLDMIIDTAVPDEYDSDDNGPVIVAFLRD